MVSVNRDSKISPRKSAGTVRKSEEEKLPGREDARAVFAPALKDTLLRPRKMLQSLRLQPPQLLHLEGGDVEERVALALWWAALLNCENVGSDGPCFECSSCLRLGADMHPDLFLLDGRSENIKIADVRALRPLLGEKPHFGERRVIILAEAQSLGAEAANSLLKVLEDPCPDTCFVFTVPQRERLLPTLISRGWVLTLPWPEAGVPFSEEMRMWESALAEFAAEGRGWFDKTLERNSVDAVKAQQIVLVGQKSLADALAGRQRGRLSALFRRLPGELLMQLDELFVESQDALQAQVNPLLVLDRMASALYSLSGSSKRMS